MKRPANQAKCLFLYLLRSSAAAAWATETRVGAASPMVNKMAPLVEDGHIQLRLARRSDVPSIQRCNLATLPENYQAQFYINHLRQWPELAIVAEHVTSASSNSGKQTMNLYSNFDPNGKPPPNIVAYVLGKIDPNNEDRQSVGHVTSLAVLHEYRRRGLAACLMDQLHHHLSGKAAAVGLHVRVSNEAATKLYQRDGYQVASIIPNYYQDGEDAYYMRKDLPLQEQEEATSMGRWLTRKRKPWETGPLRLPRNLEQDNDDPTVIVEEEPQIMTGTF